MRGTAAPAESSTFVLKLKKSFSFAMEHVFLKLKHLSLNVITINSTLWRKVALLRGTGCQVAVVRV